MSVSVIRVLMMPGSSAPKDNPFIQMLVGGFPSPLVATQFTWKQAFLGHYDVLHVHWPEQIIRRRSGKTSQIKACAMVALVLLNRLRGKPHVYTAHNIQPHERGRTIERIVLSVWAQSCQATIYLTGVAAAHSSRVGKVHIPHGDYAPFVDALAIPVVHRQQGSILAFGLMRRYKGIENLIAAVGNLLDAGSALKLSVVGEARPKEYGEELARLSVGHDSSIALRFFRQEDDELVRLIMSSEFVALPYHQVYNSGAALLALTIGTPVIVTGSPTMNELRDEYGEEWVYCLEDGWDALSLGSAIEYLRDRHRESPPTVLSRQWSSIGRRHEELYRLVLGGI